MLHPGEATWTNPRVLTILAVVFLFGAAVGCLLTRGYLHSGISPQLTSTQTMEKARNLGLDKLGAELSLSDNQKRRIASELDAYGKFYQNIEDEREDVADQGKRRILSVLSLDQQKRFYQFLKQPH